MTHNTHVLLIVLATISVAWGCSKSPSSENVGTARAHAAEARVAKLEEDLRLVTVNRDQLRRKLTLTEEELQSCRQDLEASRDQIAKLTPLATENERLGKERDEFRVLAKTRTSERDALQTELTALTARYNTLRSERDLMQTKLNGLRKLLRDHANELDAVLPRSGNVPTATVTSIPSVP